MCVTADEVSFLNLNSCFFVNDEFQQYFSFSFADDKIGTLDGVLDKLYCRSLMYLSRQISRLRPELTMPMFSGNVLNQKYISIFIYLLFLLL